MNVLLYILAGISAITLIAVISKFIHSLNAKMKVAEHLKKQSDRLDVNISYDDALELISKYVFMTRYMSSELKLNLSTIQHYEIVPIAHEMHLQFGYPIEECAAKALKVYLSNR